jgi:hypothetical protein
MKELNEFSIPFPLRRIHRRMKLPADGSVDRYDDAIRGFFHLVAPRARWLHLDIELKNDAVVFPGGFTMESKTLRRHLGDSGRVTLMGVTIGRAIETAMSEFHEKGSVLEPFILDSLGSECVEEAAIFITSRINGEIREAGFRPGKRYSPGYGDLLLEVQPFIFEQLRLGEIGMALNPSFMMIPQKSITAIIGWRHQ